MAQVSISKWEIAKMFGLVYVGELEDNSVERGYEYHYLFQMNSKEIDIKHGIGDDEAYDEDEAKEIVAEVVLAAIGKAAVSYL